MSVSNIIIFIIFLFLLYKWFFRKIPIDGLTLFFANKGTGKTTLLAAIGNDKRYIKKRINIFKYIYKKYILKEDIKLYQDKYKTVFSNTSILNTYKIDMKKDFGKLYVMDSLILDDEAPLDFSNRVNMPDHQVAYFRLQRHYKTGHDMSNDIVLVSQSWEDLNINCRRVYDNVYILKKAPILSMLFMSDITAVKRIKKYIDINEDSKKPEDFYEFVFPLFGTIFFKRNDWYAYFDSLQHPPLQNISKLESWGEYVPSKVFIKKGKILEKPIKIKK